MPMSVPIWRRMSYAVTQWNSMFGMAKLNR